MRQPVQHRGPPPSLTRPFCLAPSSPTTGATSGSPWLPYAPHPARVSPRKVKLQGLPRKDHVAANFRHELFHFHQMLRDAIARDHLQQQGQQQGQQGLHAEANVLELLTSERGDAVLKEFFAQWKQTHKSAQEVRFFGPACVRICGERVLVCFCGCGW